MSAAIVALICIYVAGFAWSWGPLGWLVPSEIQPLETRAAGTGIATLTNFLFTFLIGQIFLVGAREAVDVASGALRSSPPLLCRLRLWQ